MAETRFGTKFVESEALLAMTVDDEDAAREIISDMSEHEALALRKACRLLAEVALQQVYSARRAKQVADGTPG